MTAGKRAPIDLLDLLPLVSIMDPNKTPDPTLRVTGMTCGHCARTVERAVGKVPGVQAARVDLAAETLTIAGAPDRALVVAAVRGAGYDVEES